MSAPESTKATGRFVLPVVAICFFLSGYLVHDIASRLSGTFALLQEAHGYLVRHYLNDLPSPHALQQGMIEGMLAHVGDPYTVYVPPAQHELQTDTLAGEYGCIGVSVVTDEAGRQVLFPFPDGPAARAGIMDGDILLAVDHIEIDESFTVDVVTALLRGDEGTSVILDIFPSSSDNPQTVTLIRTNFPVPTVQGYLHPDSSSVGVLDVNLISQQTTEEIDRTLRELMNDGAAVFLLDLRGNTGGLLDEGIDVADYFLASGIIMVERTRNSGEVVYRAHSGEFGEDIQMVVLVDGSSASAAEIIAAALQQNGRALLVGTATYGKGSVQSIYELQDGSSVHITTSQWLTPSNATIDGSGLQPDLVVDAGTDSNDPTATAAIALLLYE